MNIKKANINDIKNILVIIDECEQFMLSYGSNQWSGTSKPNKDNINNDILNGSAYILINDEENIIAYMSLFFGKEACYDTIKQGRWESNFDYAVIHRLAICNDFRGQGMSKLLFDFAEKECIKKNIRSIRIDTHAINAPMKTILKNRKYKKCGVVSISENEQRDAYEKIIIPFIVGDVIQLKKTHPCGNDIFKILRIGMDFRLECEKCKSQIWLSRIDTTKRLKKRL